MDVRKAGFKGKAHFYAICSQLMRRILVDAARRRSTARHGGGLKRIDLDELPAPANYKDGRLLALDDALNELTKIEPRKARIVELRYFGGLSIAETAAVLKVSEETVNRDWRLARGWLVTEVARQAGRA